MRIRRQIWLLVLLILSLFAAFQFVWYPSMIKSIESKSPAIDGKEGDQVAKGGNNQSGLEQSSKQAITEMQQLRGMLDYYEQGRHVEERYRRLHANQLQEKIEAGRTYVYAIIIPEAHLTVKFPNSDPVPENSFAGVSRTQYPEGGAFAQIRGQVKYGDIYVFNVHFHSYNSCVSYERGESNRASDFGDEDESGDGGFEYEWYSPEIFSSQESSFLGKNNEYRFESAGDRKYWQQCKFDTPSGGFVTRAVTFEDGIRITISTAGEMGCAEMVKQNAIVLSMIKIEKMERK
ncbi:MAG: hypothetical protein AB1610_09945 [Nitrospirota bacterium]